MTVCFAFANEDESWTANGEGKLLKRVPASPAGAPDSETVQVITHPMWKYGIC